MTRATHNRVARLEARGQADDGDAFMRLARAIGLDPNPGDAFKCIWSAISDGHGDALAERLSPDSTEGNRTA